MMSASHYIFGYGSLVNPRNLARFLGRSLTNYQFCYLKNYRRCWNVAMNNQLNLPDYKYYVDARSGQRFDGFVAFLNIYPSENSQILGILFEINDQEIQQLDLRERNYHRLAISEFFSDTWNLPTSCPIWVYGGLDAAVQRYHQGMATGKIAIAQPYADAVAAAYATQGPAALAHYQATTDPPAIPILPLCRHAT